MSRHEEIGSPLLDAIEQILGERPPFPSLEGAFEEGVVVEDYEPYQHPEHGLIDLADWCNLVVSSLDGGCFWMTGSGVIQAAELLVSTAVDNANISPEKQD